VLQSAANSAQLLLPTNTPTDDQDSVPWTADKRWGLAESDRAVALAEHCSRNGGGRWAVADTTSNGGVGRCCCTVEWTSNFMEPFISYEHNDCCLPIPPTDDHNSLLRYVSRTSDVYLSDLIFANYVVV
jgi:hypothetical protein